MDHVDNQGVLCHECGAAMFKVACLQYAPHLGQAIKDWITKNIICCTNYGKTKIALFQAKPHLGIMDM
jgi:hypothetical protein